MPYVLDCSVALAWVLPDEHSAAVDLIAEQLERDRAHVPAIWPLEVGNALLVAQRRGRIPALEVGKIVNALMALPVEVDSENAIARVPEWMELAQRLALTTYDAAYVELARRRSWPLATLDVKLRAACAIVQVPVVP